MSRFYPDFRTPSLSIKRAEGKAEVLIADGRSLLNLEMTEDTPADALLDMAHHTCLYLALRNMVDITRLMRPFDPSMEMITLDKEKVHEIRYMAFLRSRIPYINQGQIKQMAGGMWGMILRKINAREVEMFPGNGEFHGITCDAACDLLPSGFHDEIYSLGRFGGGQGFNKGDVWAIAAERNIVIDSIPTHPLESLANVNKERSLPKIKGNDLPKPERMLTTRQAESKYKLDTAEIWARAKGPRGYQTVYERLAADAREPIFLITDEWANRYQFMDYIVWAVAEGEKLLKDVCRGRDGTPSMMEVHKWMDLHPDFSRAMRAAERMQAAVFKDKAQEIVESVTDKDEVAVAKLKSQFYMKIAALQDEKFRDKQVIQTEDLDKRDERDLKRQLVNLIMNNPDALPMETIQGETVKQIEGASQ